MLKQLQGVTSATDAEQLAFYKKKVEKYCKFAL